MVPPNLELARDMANGDDILDDELRKKLWLRVARTVVEQEKRINKVKSWRLWTLNWKLCFGLLIFEFLTFNLNFEILNVNFGRPKFVIVEFPVLTLEIIKGKSETLKLENLETLKL
jgi:hypothetical protein